MSSLTSQKQKVITSGLPASSRRWKLLSSFEQFYRLGFTTIILGSSIILIALYAEDHIGTPSRLTMILLNFLSHIGIAFLILGIVGIMVDLPDWQKYFQERLAETIIQKDYLNKLGGPELMNLMTNTLKAYFNLEDLDEKASFLEYFQSKIIGFIANPYREDVHGIMNIEYHASDDSFIVDDCTSYKCRKVGKHIQNEIRFTLDPGEANDGLEDFEIMLRVPQNFFQSPDFVTKYPTISDGNRCIKVGDPGLRKLDTKEGQGYVYSLDSLRDIDGLSVTVSVKYVVPRKRFLTWEMIDPSRGMLFNIRYPPDLELHCYLFGFDLSSVEVKKYAGLYSLSSDSWLLPHAGLAYQLISKPQCPAKSVSSTDDEISPISAK